MRFPVSLHILLAILVLSLAGKAACAGIVDHDVNKVGHATEGALNPAVKEIDADKPEARSQPAELSDSYDLKPGGMNQLNNGALMLAAVHFRPQMLDDEFTLLRVLLTLHPEAQTVVDNHLQWRESRDELKKQLLAEAQTAQLTFEMQPWRDYSMTKDRPVELYEYDLESRTFHVRFAMGNSRQVVTRMLMPGGGVPAPEYVGVIDRFPVAADKAEKIINYFGNKQRKVYLHYRLKAVGASEDAPLPTPVFVFVDDQLALYALEPTPQDNQMHRGYKFLATVTVPTIGTSAPMPTTRNTVEDYSAAVTGVIQNAEIDGVRLGMPIKQALEQLTEHGLNMGPPSRTSKLTGVTYLGHSTTVDGAGWIRVMIRQMNGIVYQYDKNVMYLLNRLPADISVSDLQQKYHDEFVGKVGKARYTYTAADGTLHFDDSSPPPYNRNITSPHARVTVVEGKNGGRFHAGISIEWKKPVGATW